MWMASGDYREAWTRPNTLDQLNHRIHDGVPVEELRSRAEDRRDAFFVRLFPYAAPAEGAKVLELGQGVGWIMEATLDAYPIREIVGLDVSQNMVERAAERWQDSRASYVTYDGLHVPLPDDEFDNIYSVACIQHIEKHHAFLVMKELLRILKPGGHATLELLSVHHRARGRSWEDEAWHHVNATDAHWHHYYSYDELYVLFARELDVTDFDIKYYRTSFWVHFSKGTPRRFHEKAVEKEYFLNRSVPRSIHVPR
jgi:ubiquinone/menaquinone biosynthesis C-methylase UbiE